MCAASARGATSLRLERAVELELHHSQGGVLVDPLAPRLLVRRQHLGGSLVRPRPVHEAGHDDAGADLGPVLDALLARQELVDVVGQVADRGHAGGEEVLFPVFEARSSSPRPSLVYCGDDARGKKVATTLIRDVGFEPVDAGPLRIARYTEPFGLLIGELAYGGRAGPELAYRFVRFREQG